jgi:hypothetical protein
VKADCADIQPLRPPVTLADLHRFTMDLLDLYNECSARHHAMVDIIRGREEKNLSSEAKR